MNNEMYERYLAYKNSGRKAEATDALNMFLTSVGPQDDVRAWIEAFLERGEFGHRIRHELYEQMIFPVLLESYRRGEAWGIRWLARTAQNLYSSETLHAAIGRKSEWQLREEAYAAEPTEETQRELLDTMLRWFQYSQHEWPAGILSGANGATLFECDEILQQIATACALDDGAHEPFLREFEQKVIEYKARLQRASARLQQKLD